MRATNFVGWLGVVLVTLAGSFWAFWGIIEAFHEGWCKPLLWMRLLQTAAYLSPAMFFCGFAVIGIRWPRAGAVLFTLLGITIATLIVIDQSRISLAIVLCLTALPILVGCLFLWGRPKPKKAAYLVALGIPVLTLIVSGAEPVIRVSTRIDDGDRGERIVKGQGVTLLWAPAGPGWSREGGVSWSDAKDRVRYLTKDGMSLAKEPQGFWRLPTREEVVCSLTRGNRNAGGKWDKALEQPRYERKPDKESPLWDSLAPLIYLWTAEEADEKQAWIVMYHGGVYAKPKAIGSPSFGFRAVRE
ncbi:DUF1566 domain-containing protein [Gimesia aquarii]|uniref:DUF7670 domain-containing protein n=1 Tax=Gimesia aquarii TaxID=2527964 RepID=A0A517WTY8_9PLAN|nr:DUF1566 domain-containing protein [Gimesia aquarii]QDU08691.1 hypothetical protein V202x_20610 [Gimesia aquarii]